VLLTTPAIAALRSALPSAQLVALVGPWAVEVLAGNPHLDAVLTLEFPGFGRAAPPSPWKPYVQLVHAARWLRAERFDAAVILRPDFWWGAALLALANVPVRVGVDLLPGCRALTHPVVPLARPEHATRQALRLVEATAHALAGADLPDQPWEPASLPLVYDVGEADRRWADAWLAAHGVLPGEAPMVLHPGAGAPVKQCPPHLWVQVLQSLAAETGAPVVVAGRRAEAHLVAAIAALLASARHAPQVEEFAEDVPLGQYAALLARARLALGVDSGPLHLAVALGVPSVRLYGPTDPAVFGPWGPVDLHAVVASRLPCSPCGRLDYPTAELPGHPCLRLHTPQVVMAAARQVLRTAGSSPRA
jgi:ADP-heptose:LPS heptosyltransferase